MAKKSESYSHEMHCINNIKTGHASYINRFSDNRDYYVYSERESSDNDIKIIYINNIYQVVITNLNKIKVNEII